MGQLTSVSCGHWLAAGPLPRARARRVRGRRLWQQPPARRPRPRMDMLGGILGDEDGGGAEETMNPLSGAALAAGVAAMAAAQQDDPLDASPAANASVTDAPDGKDAARPCPTSSDFFVTRTVGRVHSAMGASAVRQVPVVAFGGYVLYIGLYIRRSLSIGGDAASIELDLLNEGSRSVAFLVLAGFLGSLHRTAQPGGELQRLGAGEAYISAARPAASRDFLRRRRALVFENAM